MFWNKGTRSIDVTQKIFGKIMDGGYSASPSKSWFKTSLNGIQSQEGFSKQLSAKNNVILQGLREGNKIKIVC